MRLKPRGLCPPCGSPGAPQPCGTQQGCWCWLGTPLVGNPPPGYVEGGGTAAWDSQNVLCILYFKPHGSKKGPSTESSCPPKHKPCAGPASAAVGEGQPPGKRQALEMGRCCILLASSLHPKMRLALSLWFPKGTHFRCILKWCSRPQGKKSK